MSDEDLRRGYRAMVSGGLCGLDDDAVAALAGACADSQRSRGISPALDEVLYLQEFMKISEEYITDGSTQGFFNIEEAHSKVSKLNEMFPNINPKIRKATVLCSDLGSQLEDQGWMSSSWDC